MVRWNTYNHQTHQIRNYHTYFNNVNAKIRQRRIDIINWSRAYKIAKDNVKTSYKNKEDSRKYLIVLNNKITEAKAELVILLQKRDALQLKIDDLTEIIRLSETSQTEMNDTTVSNRNTLTSEIIPKNTTTNITYYTDMQFQNDTLIDNIQEMQNEYTTNDQNTLATYTNTKNYAFVESILFIVYYLFVILFLYMAYSKQYINNKYVLVTIILSMCVYPFYILNIEKKMYETFVYLWALMKGIPYNTE